MANNLNRRSFLGLTAAAPLAAQTRPGAAAKPAAPAASYDVIVCGGGTAGLPAAVAAARRGARVAIIERYGFLGGNPATSIMPTWHGLSGHHSGLLTEFAGRVKEFGLGPDPLKYDSNIEPEAVKALFLRMAVDAGVQLHLHSFIVGVQKTGNRVERVITESKSGRRSYAAKVFVDASGDGDVAVRAGAPFNLGDNGKTQGMTLRFTVGQVNFDRYLDWAVTQPKYFGGLRPDRVEQLKDRARKGESFYLGSRLSEMWEKDPDEELPRNTYFNTACIRLNELSINSTRVYDLDPTNTDDLTKAEVTCRLQAVAIWRYLKKHVPGFDKSILSATAPAIGVRESRVIVGDYLVTTSDFESFREFPDSVLTCIVSYDSHDKQFYNTKNFRGGLGEIPYRCFLPKGIDGLLVAGRCLSSDHLTNSAIRRMESAFQTGEVAGTAAYMALKERITPRKLAVKELQAELTRSGVKTNQAAFKSMS